MDRRNVPISEARANLSDLVTETTDNPVYLLRHGKPVAVLVDADKYERLIDRLEYLEDTLAALQASANPDTVPFETHGHPGAS